jgi:purine-nucleoside phosphorylase
MSEAIKVVRNAIGTRQPVVGMILGSGLGGIAEAASDRVVIPYGDIPGFHVSDVEGHAGQLVFGEIDGCAVMIMQGRFHYYEGVSMEAVAFPVALMGKLGVSSIIITSASGGVNPQFKKGDIMVLDDHINFVFRNPIRGSVSAIDMYDASEPDAVAQNDYGFLARVNTIYDQGLKQLAYDVGQTNDIHLQTGVYLMVSGPSYETKAEIRMVRKLGGDVVGMSTVPEAIAARQLGMRVLGITYVSNMASGMAPGPLVHSHVMETMDMIRDDMMKLIAGIVHKINNSTSSADV